MIDTVNDLPAIAGRRIECSNAIFEQRCLFYIQQEQEKIMPDNALIDLLCDGVRLSREYTDIMNNL